MAQFNYDVNELKRIKEKKKRCKKLLSYLSSSGETIIIEFKKREAVSHILIEIT